MKGMLEVNLKTKSLGPVEAANSLEYTNQLIKMLAGEKESEELKVGPFRKAEVLR